MKLGLWIIGMGVGISLAPSPAAAADGDAERCISAAEMGQDLRDDHKEALAREAFAICQRPVCPAVVRRDCVRWEHEMDQRSSPVAGRVEAGTSDHAPTPPSGEAAPPQPDAHERAIPGEASPSAVTSTSVVTPSSPPRAFWQRVPTASWVLLGVAVASFASEAYFGVTGLSDFDADTAPGGCAPHCTSADRSAIQTKLILADASLGLGVVSTALAGIFFLTAGDSSPPPKSFAIAPTAGGGVAVLRFSF